jgi:hypothetical protein
VAAQAMHQPGPVHTPAQQAAGRHRWGSCNRQHCSQRLHECWQHAQPRLPLSALGKSSSRGCVWPRKEALQPRQGCQQQPYSSSSTVLQYRAAGCCQQQQR